MEDVPYSRLDTECRANGWHQGAQVRISKVGGMQES